MALNIKSPHADRLARELAELTGESITDALVEALEERLARERARRRTRTLRDEVRRVQERISRLPVLDERPAEEILGYDQDGLPT
jgi:antitoxin VapB